MKNKHTRFTFYAGMFAMGIIVLAIQTGIYTFVG